MDFMRVGIVGLCLDVMEDFDNHKKNKFYIITNWLRTKLLKLIRIQTCYYLSIVKDTTVT